MPLAQIQLDTHVSVGSILQAGGIVVALLASHMANRERLKGIETKVDLMFNWFTRGVIEDGKGLKK